MAAEAKAEEEQANVKTEDNAVETEKENLPGLGNESKAAESPAAAVAAKVGSSDKVKQEVSPNKQSTNSKTSPAPANSSAGNAAGSNSRKRGLPVFTDGKSWAKANTRLKSSQYASLRSAEEYINENVQFKPEFFKRINEEGSKTNAKVDQCPIKRITGDDIVGGYSKFSLGLKKTVHRIAQRFEEENGVSFFTVPVATTTEPAAKTNLIEKFVAVGNGTGDDDLL